LHKIYLMLMGFCCWVTVNAQDANYWSASYNPSGFLIPGSAVAFTGDSGVLYFNPALLAYNTKNSATISGSVYQYNALKLKDGAGDGLPLRSSNVSVIPVMASGILSIKGKKRFTIGYALVHNPVINYQSTQQLDKRLNVLNDAYSPGPENFLAQYSAQNIVNETSGILSTGFKLSSNFAFGLSAEAQYREQHREENYSARALINTNDVSGLPPLTNVEQQYQISHYNVGLKFKAGLAYDKGNHHAGLTITSPLAKIMGSGQLLSDNVITDLRDTPTDTLNFLASTRQTGVKEKWKMPLSFAGGYVYEAGWGQLSFSTEYFLPVKEYDFITPRDADFIRTNSDTSFHSSDLLKFRDARKSVMNFGVGISYLLKPDVTAFLAFRTDFCYADSSRYSDADSYTANTSHYDIYHLQAGGNIKRRKFNLRAGLLLDYGHTSRYPQPVNMPTANEGNFLSGDVHTVRATYFSIGLMFAYIHNL
jgi:hypothetical protein